MKWIITVGISSDKVRCAEIKIRLASMSILHRMHLLQPMASTTAVGIHYITEGIYYSIKECWHLEPRAFTTASRNVGILEPRAFTTASRNVDILEPSAFTSVSRNAGF